MDFVIVTVAWYVPGAVWVALPTVQEPLAVIAGVAVVVVEAAVTVNVAPLFAVEGAPVKLTEGVAVFALTVSVLLAALLTVLMAQFAARSHLPEPVSIWTLAATDVPLAVLPVI